MQKTLFIVFACLLAAACWMQVGPEKQTGAKIPKQEEIKPAPRSEITVPTTPRGKVPILMFHYVREVDVTEDELGYNLSTDPATFEGMLAYLSSHDYKTVHLADLEAGNRPPKAIALTFDDGYQDFYTTVFPLLQKYHLTASTAVITGRLDGTTYLSPAQVKELHDKGIEILSHTVNHVDLTKTKNAVAELKDSKAFLENLLGEPVTGFVYPAGKYNAQTLEDTRAAGYAIAATTKEGFANLDGNLLELRRIRIDNRDGLKGFVRKLISE